MKIQFCWLTTISCNTRIVFQSSEARADDPKVDRREVTWWMARMGQRHWHLGEREWFIIFPTPSGSGNSASSWPSFLMQFPFAIPFLRWPHRSCHVLIVNTRCTMLHEWWDDPLSTSKLIILCKVMSNQGNIVASKDSFSPCLPYWHHLCSYFHVTIG